MHRNARRIVGKEHNEGLILLAMDACGGGWEGTHMEQRRSSARRRKSQLPADAERGLDAT
jgi:hypothetical protein